MRAWLIAGLGLLVAACGSQQVKPDAVADETQAATASVDIRIEAGPVYRWNGEALDIAQIERRFVAMAEAGATPVVSVTPDVDAEYDATAAVMALGMKYGVMRKLGVIGGT